MRFAFLGSVFLVGLSSVSLAVAQETPAKEKADAPDSAEASESAAETQAASDESSEETDGEPEESTEPPTPDDEAVARAEVSSEKAGKDSDEGSEKAEKESQAETTAAVGDELADEGESDSDAEPAADEATDAPLKSDADDSAGSSNEKVERPRTGFVFAPRLGLTVGGATHLGVECEETGDLGCGTFGIRDHKEASGFAVAADALYGLIPELRLGATLMWLPQAKGDAGGEIRRLGTEVQLQAVAEGVFDLVDSLAVTVRVQGGGTVLAPTGFVDDVVKGAQDDCELARDAGVDCTVHDGPYFAPVYGGGAGILVQTKGAARLRLDFLFETQTLPLYEQKAASDGGTVQANVTMDQSRFWLFGGFEI